MKKEEFSKRLNTLFKKVGVKKLDLHSKEVFSYSHKTDFVMLYKKRSFIVTFLFVTSLALQVLSLVLAAVVPEPRYFMTTINGHVYEISNPRQTKDEAIAVNKMIEGKKTIIRSTTDDDS